MQVRHKKCFITFYSDSSLSTQLLHLDNKKDDREVNHPLSEIEGGWFRRKWGVHRVYVNELKNEKSCPVASFNVDSFNVSHFGAIFFTDVSNFLSRF